MSHLVELHDILEKLKNQLTALEEIVEGIEPTEYHEAIVKAIDKSSHLLSCAFGELEKQHKD